MGERLDRMDREQIIFQLLVHTIYTEEALMKLSDKQLVEMYKVKVEEA